MCGVEMAGRGALPRAPRPRGQFSAPPRLRV